MIHYRLRATYQEYLETVRKERAEETSCPHEETSVHTRGVWLVCEDCGEYLEWVSED